MNFANAARHQSHRTYTENGARAHNTTGTALLDFFGSVGSLRLRAEVDIERLFAEAYMENPLLATKCMFYARDIRGGLGERRTFRILLKYAAQHNPEAIIKNISLIPEFGRWDDLYELVGTPVEKAMFTFMGGQLAADEEAMRNGEPCSLLAKWVKTPDASSPNTRALGIKTAAAIHQSVYVFKRRLRALRKYIDVVECKMSANDWDDIKYSAVPSRAMLLYKRAFENHDYARFHQFLNDVAAGNEKINSSTLFPYDIVEAYEKQHSSSEDPTLEAQWKALPNYLDKPENCIVMADTSESMTRDNGRPMHSSVALAVYFAERNQGAYHNLWMSFSGRPTIHELRGETLKQKLASIERKFWSNNTNLEAAFQKVLDIAIENHVPKHQMVKSIIVISDMEIDQTQYGYSWSFYNDMRNLYKANGYSIPNVVFWNVNAQHDVFHADANRIGVQLCSGHSAATFKALMACVGKTPVEMMKYVLESKRYADVVIANR